MWPCLLWLQVPTGSAYTESFLAAWSAFEEGELAAANAGYARCLQLAPESPTLAYHIACLRAREGRGQEALEWLGKAVEEGFEDGGLLVWEPDLASLRGDARLAAILERLNGEERPTEPAATLLPHALEPQSSLPAAGGDWSWSRDGQRTLQADCLWDRRSGEALASLRTRAGLRGARLFDWSGRWILGSAENHIELWDAVTGTSLGRIDAPLPSGVESFASDRSGRYLLCTGSYVRVLFDLEARRGVELPRIYPSHLVVLSPTGDRLLFVDDGYATLVEPRSGKLYAYVRGVGEGPHAVCFRPDGERVAWVDCQGSAWLLDARSGAVLRSLRSAREDRIRSLCFDPADGSWLTVRKSGRFEWWKEGETAAVRVAEALPGQLLALVVEPERGALHAITWVQSGLQCVELHTRAPSWPGIDGPGIQERLRRARFPGFERGYGVDVLELDSNADGLGFLPPARRLQGVAVSETEVWEDDRHATLLCQDGTTRLLDLGTGRLSACSEPMPSNWSLDHIRPVGSDRALVARREGYELRDIQRGQRIATFTDDVVIPSPDGERLLVVNGTAARIVSTHDQRTQVELEESPGRPSTSRYVWSPDGRRIACTLGVPGEEGRILVWQTGDGALVAKLAGLPERPITSVCFDARGEELLVGLGDEDRELEGGAQADGQWTSSLDPKPWALLWRVSGAERPAELVLGDLWYSWQSTRACFVLEGRLLLLAIHDGENETVIQAFDRTSLEQAWPALRVQELRGSWDERTLLTEAGGVDLETGRSVPVFSSTAPRSPSCAVGSERVLCRMDDETVAILDRHSWKERYRRIEFEEQQGLAWANGPWIDGSAEALRLLTLEEPGAVSTLDCWAGLLLDPRRLRAAAAGIELVPPRLPARARFVEHRPAERWLSVQGDSLLLEAEACDARGLLAFALVRDGVELDLAQEQGSTSLADGGEGARLHWMVERDGSVVSELAVRPRTRDGLLGEAWRLTVAWD